ncbi:MAG: UDP-N-acetylmuramoyl-L-alanyl-D-glutamate--2,6-diaminopimelate ligase [Patescibacteria group bacterium]|nr:UDP-N-acetylmuramyl-tripeptide synthetase [Candidatus Saccharibacteria bacterium]MDQ5963517.1 UDP-N-acetylmuramoyl-L-alanyl-D-glutamate--2,6-diaminopimelate ligase [Patescibacteria group bacterium]
MSVRKFVKALVPRSAFDRVEPVGHLLEAVFWNVLYGFPARGMKVIGVTGTNGKTTTTFLIHRMLVESGIHAGIMTTVGYGVGHSIEPQVHHMTNVGPRELMKRLREMKGQGMDWLVLETTSHALAQHRTWGVPYSVAVLTNITHEHLDYHKTFERYAVAKKKLFILVGRNTGGLNIGIANADDPVGEEFAGETKHPMLYGVSAGGVRATDITLATNGLNYTVTIDDEEAYKIHTSLPGSFNVYNTLAAVCVGRALGLTRRQVEHGIRALEGVEGRMTTINQGQKFNVVVDFAHTPDSFEKLLKDIRPVVSGKLIVLFGSAGRRDEAKRAIQGRLAGSYADEVIVTEEDDRDCDGVAIMGQIAAGAEEFGKIRDTDLFLVHDRTRAIEFAMTRASGADDTILLLGKGHEKTIERANGEEPWDEIHTANTALIKLLGTHK